MALWKIVSLECVPQFEKGETLIPPCEHVDIAGGKDRGYVDFKDQRGVAQMLTIPIRRVTGIEDPALLEPDAPNYFAGAWGARAYVEGHLHRSLPREAVAISVNSMVRRSQDQLHFHVDCVDNEVATTLAEYKDRLDSQWRPMSVALKGRHYWARRSIRLTSPISRPFGCSPVAWTAPKIAWACDSCCDRSDFLRRPTWFYTAGRRC